MAADKKIARRRGAWICFQDESGVSLLPVVRATWAPKGDTPVLHHRFSWKRLSMAGVLAYRPDRSRSAFVFSMTDGAYNTDKLIEFLTELPGPRKGRVSSGQGQHECVIGMPGVMP
ncbi:transposase [Rhodococcus pyridinivorans]|uniref:transposase n=1 Tax=Rhodococcus pyridinivorans TaxID=103816 RepID=UPI003CE4A8FD